MRIFKYIMRKIFFLFILLSLSRSFVFGQGNLVDSIASQFDRYSLQSLQEKIFVHTDKSFYVPGEIIWFKVYDVDGHFNKPLDLSKIAYVEVLSTDQKPVLQAKIALKSGSGSGSFLIPFSFNSGNYVLRAYTNWMKNFLPEFYFEKMLTIVNPLKKPGWSADENSTAYDIQFFPEGGNMVNGMQSKIAFRVADHYGRGVDCNGVIVNQRNDTIARFQSLKFGLGHFLFTPAHGESYTAIIFPGKNTFVKHNLPIAYETGYVMNLADQDNEHILVTVSGNDPVNNLFYLLVHTRHVIKVAQAKEVNAGKAEFLLDKKMFGEGISQLTVFNYKQQPVCERLYFKRPAQNLVVGIKPDKEIYNRREKVNLQLLAENSLNKPAVADLSMSVFLADSLQTANQNNIFSYLWLSSDLKGNIESPEYYIKNTGTEVDEAIDNLMLTHGWRRFRWEDVMQNKKPAFEFIPEYDGHLINGRIVDKRSGLPVENIPTYLSVPGIRFQLGIATSNQKGLVRFDMHNFYGAGEIVVQTNTKSDSLYRIEISSPYAEKFSTNSYPPFDLSEKFSNELVFNSMNAQVQNTFITSKRPQFILPVPADSTAFYGIPDKKYFLDDYTRFITMEEVMREYIAEVHVRKKLEKFHFDAQDIPYKNFFDNNPLVLFDGVPVYDIDKVMAFDPLKVKKIEIIARKYSLDSVVNDGIVSYTTYQGDLAGFQLDPNALILEYPGLQLQREFFSPVYETAAQVENRAPDFRNLLYWSPNIKTNEQGKKDLNFYTSDLPGHYAVVIQGITADGMAGSTILYFDVKR